MSLLIGIVIGGATGLIVGAGKVGAIVEYAKQLVAHMRQR